MVRIRIDFERMFLNHFSIKKKPDDIFDLIEFGVEVAQSKYPTQFNKRKHKMLNMLANSGIYKDDEEQEAIVEEKSSSFQEEEKSATTTIEEEENLKKTTETQDEKANTTVSKNPVMKNSEESGEQQLDDGDEKGTNPQQGNITGDSRKKETTEDIKGLKKRDFESSKRKFEERIAEQKEAKRRIIMVDFHDMPKPAKDPSAAPKRCCNRTRF